MVARFLDTLLELTERQEDGDQWRKSLRLVQMLGGTDLNVATFNSQSKALSWVRSSMSRNWLNDYLAQGFLTCDPLVTMLKTNQRHLCVISGDDGARASESDQQTAYFYGLKDAGYGSATGFVTPSHEGGAQKLVVFGSDTGTKSPLDLHEASVLKLASTVISASIGKASAPDLGNMIHFQKPLSPRETDVLCYLATGLRNDAIAYKLKIAEVTVRMHLTSARKKMHAETREEAIANALVGGWISP